MEAMRGKVMWLHPHPNLLPKAVVKTVLVSLPIPSPPRDGAHVWQACFWAPQLTKVLQNREPKQKLANPRLGTKP